MPTENNVTTDSPPAPEPAPAAPVAAETAVTTTTASPPAPEKAPEPPKRKSALADVLPANIIALIKAAPENEVYRAHVLACIKRPLPPEAKTFEQIQDWIEFNIEPVPGAKVVATSRAPNSPAVNIQVWHSYKDHGRCSYTQEMVGNYNFTLTVQRLGEELQRSVDVGDSWGDFVHRIQDLAEEACSENPPNCTPTDNVDHFDCESDDESTDHNSRVSRTTMEVVLRTAVAGIFPQQFNALARR